MPPPTHQPWPHTPPAACVHEMEHSHAEARAQEHVALADGFLPLPVVDGATLTYERFLREFALPRQPCIITNIGSEWTARQWCVKYLLSHEGVDTDYKVRMAVGSPQSAREQKTTVGAALKAVGQTADADGNPVPGEAHPFYLSAWDYVRGNSSALQEEFDVPRFFERAPSWLSSHVVLGNAATDMKWLYIGSRGSGSATHVDTNLSSAWLWVAQGRKEWVCAHGGDHALLTAGTGSRAYGYKSGGDESDGDGDGSDGGGGGDSSVPLPDFFSDGLFERWPHAKSARLYRGHQEPGEVCFNPSRCVHAVRNVGDHVTVSLTHNFVDASNLPDVLSDATRSLHEELLPMAKSLKPKTVIKTLAKSLQISKVALVQTLLELPDLLTDERIEEVIRQAAEGAVGDDESGPEAVEQLLGGELQTKLKEVRPAFREAALALRDALRLQGMDEKTRKWLEK